LQVKLEAQFDFWVYVTFNENMDWGGREKVKTCFQLLHTFTKPTRTRESWEKILNS